MRQWIVHQAWSFLLAFLYTVQGQTSNCPPQCICAAELMNCKKSGLTQLPKPHSPDIEILVVENQTFSSPHLGQRDLSVYLSTEFGGKIRLKQLYLRYCNIESIEPYAFKGLGSQFQMLDLTGNPLKRIGEYAFSGLKHLTLILDEVKSPYFAMNTFSGLINMKFLTIRHAGLSKLPLDQLENLVTDGKLGKLLLSGNQLRTLDVRYENVFKSLQQFEISDNPWHCDCKLTWLIRVYRSMVTGNGGGFLQRGGNRWSDSDAHDDNQPKCASPPALVGRSFIDLITDTKDIYTQTAYDRGRIPTVLHCPPPKIEQLHIDLERLLSDGNQQEKYEHQLTVPSAPGASVRLHCVVRGSPQLTVKWQYYNRQLRWENISNAVAKSHSSNKSFTEVIKSPWSSKSQDTTIRSESSITVKEKETQDSYGCFGEDVLGNVSVVVRIKWPKFTHIKPPSPPVVLGESQNGPRNVSTEEIVESVSAYEEKRFTLLQLIGAVLGTLVCTIILFIGCIICYQSSMCVAENHNTLRQMFIKKKVRDHKSGSSEGGTSSWNTTSSNPNNVSPPKMNELPPTFPAVNFNPTPMAYHPHLFNAQLFNQQINGIGNGLQTAQPFSIGYTQFDARPTCIIPPTSQYDPHSAGNNFSATSSNAYEPTLYAEANTENYENPWQSTIGRMMQQGPVPGNTEQSLPLLQDIKTDSQPQMVSTNLLTTTHTIPPSLLIPPPPSIPQPSLPGSTSSLTPSTSVNRNSVTGNVQQSLQPTQPGSFNQDCISLPFTHATNMTDYQFYQQ